ncbi:uncharacterized protein LOC122663271 [Telopea speciosissima]|uniref:uncharacterized protein LOC122663271 n=1 Tax=Telopea speciosissima TaxID=54955 RepID=UPI001CC4FFB8|nr:uncharacterized protein LOC122663271 [Telopea speciosissima]
MSWSSNDDFFVSSKLEVFAVDLFSEPVELTRCKAVIYDGPKGEDFKRFLRSKNFRVNRQGKVIVRVQKRDDDGEFLEGEYDNFVLEMVVPLGPFGFQNIQLSKPQEVNELQSLLDNTKAELAKKNDEPNELQSLLDNTEVELAKKNDLLNELMKCDDDGEFFDCQDDSFILETVVPLDTFGFQNVPLPKSQAVNKLQSILNNTKAELAKKNDELNELQSLFNNTKAELENKNDPLHELAKKNDAFTELMKHKIDQDWNPEQFGRLNTVAITNSVKRVFVDFGLEPPASGDPRPL